MKHFGDITKLNGYLLPPVDIITGGSPCQDLSVAGKREGLAGERSGLFMEQIRVIKEMRENDRRNGRTGYMVRPRYAVWENVTGALSSPGRGHTGEDYQAVLTEFVRIVEPSACDVPLPAKGKWPKSGALMGYGADGCPFSIAWRVHDAQFWGVPQRRKRISLVADFGGPTAPEILFERESVSGDLEPCAEEREETAGAVKGSPGMASYTLKIRGGADTYIKPDGSIGTAGKGPLVQEELSGTLGVSQDQTLITTAEEPVCFDGSQVTNPTNVTNPKPGDPCHTIHPDARNYVVREEPILLESNQNNATVQTDGVSTALPASAGMGGGYVPMIAYGFEPGVAQRLNTEARFSEERSPTLRSNAGDNQASVCYSIDKAVTTGANCTAGGDCVHREYTSPLTTDRPHAVAYGVVSKGNGDAFISEERHTSLSTGGGEPGQGYPCVVYGISPYASNAMLSDNPNSGIYEADTARTLDLNGGSPACNQGGMAIVQGADVYNGTLTGEIAATITEAVGMPNTSGAKVLSYGLDGYNQAIEEETAQPLRSADGGDTTPKVVCLEGNGSRPSHRGDGYSESETMYTLNGTEHHAVYDARGNGDGDVAMSITSHASDPHHIPTVCVNQGKEQDVYCIGNGQPDQLSLSEKVGALNCMHDQQSVLVNDTAHSMEVFHCTSAEEQVHTLRARDYKDPQVVTYGIDQQGGNGVCAAIDCRNGTEDTDVNASLQSASAHNINSNNVCRQNSVVRRLTPLECERLQGFPDGWTDIGDWVDNKGKLHKGEADSPRYKALGNSIALPFWQWMADRMLKYIDHPATMASLFDGIGGFPLVFSRCGCTPVWASEIEEFPIAVTKIHFPEKE